MNTIQEVKDLAESILDQTIEDSLFIAVLNTMKNRREEMRAWQFLLKLKDTDSASTSPIALPDDFRLPRKLLVGTGFQPYTPVRFDEQHLYRNSSNRYFLDMANNTYKLLGTAPTGTVYLYYLKTTPEIEELTDVLTWPKRFWSILSYEIAGYIQSGVDADDIFARMSPENKGQALLLAQQMENWDNQLQIASQNGRVGVADSEPEISIGNM